VCAKVSLCLKVCVCFVCVCVCARLCFVSACALRTQALTEWFEKDIIYCCIL